MKKTLYFFLAIVGLSFLIGILVYSKMPIMVASHWDAQGEINGYVSRFWGVFLMPIISIALIMLFLLIPKIDPLKKNIADFQSHYDKFIVVVLLFLFIIYIQTILWNLGIKIGPLAVMPWAFAILLYSVGDFLQHTKRNWFVGIRTQWTLSSDKVWKKTHALGAKLYKISALISLLGIFSAKYTLAFVLAPILASSLYLVLYSYLEFEKEK